VVVMVAMTDDGVFCIFYFIVFTMGVDKNEIDAEQSRKERNEAQHTTL
jgi:hypothetical protein